MEKINYYTILIISFTLLLNFCQKQNSVPPSLSDYDFYSMALDSLFQADRLVVLRDSIVNAERVEYQQNHYLRPIYSEPLSPIPIDSINTNIRIQTININRYNEIMKGPGLVWMNFYDQFPNAVGFVTLTKIYRHNELSKLYFVVNIECGVECKRSYEITLNSSKQK